MREDADDRPASKTKHQVGEPLDMLSVDELRERIGLLEAEIARLEAAFVAKQASRNAADAVFRR